ncbi:MAG: hypothetical protein ACRDXX_19820, partial [Stackebrandtia sp.]
RIDAEDREEAPSRLRDRRAALLAQQAALGEWFAQVAEYGATPGSEPVYTLDFAPGARDGSVPARFVVSIGGEIVTHRLGESTLFERDAHGRLRVAFVDVLADPDELEFPLSDGDADEPRIRA